MAKKQKGKVFWLTKDGDGGSVGDEIVAWAYKSFPQKDKQGDWYSDDGCIDTFEDGFFEDWTGITLKPGERRRVRLVTG